MSQLENHLFTLCFLCVVAGAAGGFLVGELYTIIQYTKDRSIECGFGKKSYHTVEAQATQAKLATNETNETKETNEEVI
jgi:hypothetical protein